MVGRRTRTKRRKDCSLWFHFPLFCGWEKRLNFSVKKNCNRSYRRLTCLCKQRKRWNIAWLRSTENNIFPTGELPLYPQIGSAKLTAEAAAFKPTVLLTAVLWGEIHPCRWGSASSKYITYRHHSLKTRSQVLSILQKLRGDIGEASEVIRSLSE